MCKKKYDVNAIIENVLALNIDISPEDRLQWTIFGCALKVLGYNVDIFFALSHCEYNACVNVWRKEKTPERFFSHHETPEDGARAKIVLCAKNKGLNLTSFVLPEGCEYKTTKQTTFLQAHKPETNEPPREPFSKNKIAQSHLHYKETALYHWFCNLEWLAVSDIDRVFELYQMGGSAFGKDYFHTFCGTAFPYINREGVCYTYKLVIYNPETGRSKSNDGKRYGITTKGGCAPCFFGEHLLTLRPDAPVEIVESEKSALMAAIYYPEKIWMACGGLEQLNESKIKALKGRKIILCPDRDGYAKWREFAVKLSKLGYNVAITEVLHKNPGGVKDDICDLIVCFEENKRKERTQAELQENTQKAPKNKLPEKIISLWEDFAKTFPGVQDFAEEFNLNLLNVFENVDKTFDGVHV